MADEVLVATTSEFGRRVPDNESNGLDHGAGSFVMLLGPVNQGFVGDYPDLTTLDRDDNIVATVAHERLLRDPRREVVRGALERGHLGRHPARRASSTPSVPSARGGRESRPPGRASAACAGARP